MIDLTASSGSIAIGDLSFVNDRGTDFTDSDGKYFLRTGLAKAVTGYETAAALEYCKVSGVAVVNATSVATTQVADNGTGTIVACYGDATNVLVSTNGGLNWAPVAHGLSAPAVAVVWNGSRFIIGGCSTTNLYTRYSANGTSWSAGGTQAATATADSIRASWSGTVALFVAAGSTAACFSTSDGVTLTARTLPVSMTAPISLATNGAMFLVAHAATTFYSTTNGSSFTTRTIGLTNSVRDLAYIGGLWLVFQVSSAANYFSSSDLSTWVARKVPVYDSIASCGRVTYDAVRCYMSVSDAGGSTITNRILWTADGISWRFRTMSTGLAGNANWHIHAGKLAIPAVQASASIMRIPDWGVADFVGTSKQIVSGIESGSGEIIAYVRLK